MLSICSANFKLENPYVIMYAFHICDKPILSAQCIMHSVSNKQLLLAAAGAVHGQINLADHLVVFSAALAATGIQYIDWLI